MLTLSCSGCRGLEASNNTTTNTTIQTATTTDKATNAQVSSNIISFNTKTIDDESVTSDIFKDYKITMINIWATWCNPCVAEMPDLSKLYEELPEGSNVIGVIIDVANDEDALKDAKNIISTYNIKYKNLIPDKSLADYINKNIGGFPTSIFVDKDGIIIGDPQMGAPFKKGDGDIVLGYKRLIEERISMVK